MNSETTRTRLRCLAAVFFVLAGASHFFRLNFYSGIIPPGFPSPKMLVVIISGVAEIAGGIGILIPSARRMAGWGLLALLVAVFPANIYMAAYPERFGIPAWILWVRLPFQVVFFAWVWFVALRRSP